MKNAGESKLGRLSAGVEDVEPRGLSRRQLQPGPPMPKGPNDPDDNTI